MLTILGRSPRRGSCAFEPHPTARGAPRRLLRDGSMRGARAASGTARCRSRRKPPAPPARRRFSPSPPTPRSNPRWGRGRRAHRSSTRARDVRAAETSRRRAPRSSVAATGSLALRRGGTATRRDDDSATVAADAPCTTARGVHRNGMGSRVHRGQTTRGVRRADDVDDGPRRSRLRFARGPSDPGSRVRARGTIGAPERRGRRIATTTGDWNRTVAEAERWRAPSVLEAPARGPGAGGASVDFRAEPSRIPGAGVRLRGRGGRRTRRARDSAVVVRPRWRRASARPRRFDPRRFISRGRGVRVSPNRGARFETARPSRRGPRPPRRTAHTLRGILRGGTVVSLSVAGTRPRAVGRRVDSDPSDRWRGREPSRRPRVPRPRSRRDASARLRTGGKDVPAKRTARRRRFVSSTKRATRRAEPPTRTSPRPSTARRPPPARRPSSTTRWL